MARRRGIGECQMDMTPMIDCVFQLIIFFIVVISLAEKKNEEIELAMGPHGPLLKDTEKNIRPLVIEVDKRGNLSMQGIRMTRQTLEHIVRFRRNRIGDYPIMIRADYRTQHKDVRAVMDMCTKAGVYRVSFTAIKEKKARGSG
ncbi:MAG: biopolymer transporter ExbD [Kiritimatiellae bacterium]|nr:biopolymer transporter ExbD [Kiritimatiellia bacterium]